MEMYIERMIKEESNLALKMGAIKRFINNGPPSEDYDYRRIKLLKAQLDAMCTYQRILHLRIEMEIEATEKDQTVLRGRWSECYTDSHHYCGICSLCGRGAIRKVESKPLAFCPNCGKPMENEEEDKDDKNRK